MENTMATYPVLLKVDEVAKILRKGKNFVYEEIKAGRLPATILGKRSVRVSRDNVIQKYLSSTGGVSNAEE